MRFSETSFFLVILPPIIFAAGYTLKRRNFVRNAGAILALGVIGTVLAMLVQSLALVLANHYLLERQVLPAECLLLVSFRLNL